MDTFAQVRLLLGDTLGLGSHTRELDRSTALVGNLPEFDSMSVVSLLTAVEQHFGFTLADDEISADIFETLGSLSDFVEAKVKETVRPQLSGSPT